jgi:hypothetical protein
MGKPLGNANTLQKQPAAKRNSPFLAEVLFAKGLIPALLRQN